MDIYREIHGEDAAIPQEMEEQKAGVYKELEELREGAAKMDELFKNVDLRVSSLLYAFSFVLITSSLCVHSYIIWLFLR